MIRFENVTIRTPDFSLENISFELDTGKYGVIMGQTGSGKTTLLEITLGLRKINKGTIILNDRDVTKLHPANRGIGYVPQDFALFSTMSVRQHLEFAMKLKKWKQPDIEARVKYLADILGIEHLLHRMPANLSGGEKQRTALGRALAANPAVLCLDEPMSALDDATRANITELMRTIKAKTRVTVLHVTHNRSEADSLADKIFRIENGQLKEFGLKLMM